MSGASETGASSVRGLLRLMALPAGERRRLALAVALSAGAAAAAIALLSTSGWLISRAAQRPQILSLMVAIVAVRGFGLSRALLRYGERLGSHDLALRQLARLRGRFFARLVPLVPGELRSRSGELLARFVTDVDTLSELYLRALIPGAVALLVVFGASLAAWAMLPAAGLLALASLLLSATLVPWLAARLAVRADRRQGALRARLLGELVETIDGAEELIVCGHGAPRVASLDRLDSELSRLGRRDALAAGAATALGGALSAAGLLAVLVVGIGAVHEGRLAGVLLAALAFLLLAAYDSLLPLPAAARSLRTCAQAGGRLAELDRARPEVCDPPSPRALPDRLGDCGGHGELPGHGDWGGHGGLPGRGERGGHGEPPGRGEGADEGLRAEGVSFGYEPEGPALLHEVDLHLVPGESLALLGPSGIGKSTLAELLVRFRDPDAGRVTLEGIDVRELGQEELRSAVLLCGQDAHLFHTSVRENLRLARPGASDEELMRALAIVELDGWAATLPQGLGTIVGGDGDGVSGGQRQRLALARAMLSPARLLILDEPTAHLEPELAGRVMSRVLAAGAGRGVLVITHDREVAELCGGLRSLAEPSASIAR